MSMFCWHGFFVGDLDWRGEKQHAEAIHRVLARWALAAGKPMLWKIRNGSLVALSGADIKKTARIPGNLLMNYRLAQFEMRKAIPSSESVFGTRPDGEEVWPVEINLLLGVDLKVIASGYGAEFTVDLSPREAGKWVKPFSGRSYPAPPRDHPRSKFTLPSLAVETAWPSSWSTSPPRLSWSNSDPVLGTPFRGSKPRHGALWRSGIVFDFGKSQPSWASSFGKANTYRCPGRGFVKNLEEAFRTELVEATLYF